MSSAMIWIGMDVHKDTVMAAVYLDNAQEPEIVQQLVNDTRKLKRFFDRWSRRGEIRSCYEASGAGYVLQRAISEWGYDCEIIAPSRIPVRPGERRKHDRKDATQLARLYRAGELVTIRIPSVAEEQVHTLLSELFANVDSLSEGSLQAYLISPDKAKQGLSIPLHPAAAALLRDSRRPGG